MASKIGSELAAGFRQKFTLPSSSLVQRYYPKHMYGSYKHMQAKLRAVDCIVEVHDARLPFTGRNPTFQQNLYAGGKPHVLVLNKMDLVESDLYQPIEEALYSREKSLRNVVWTNCVFQPWKSLNKVMDAILEQIVGLPRFNREYRSDYTIMIIGVPNVGKSSLINAMRKTFARLRGDVTAVGPKPGVTRSVMTKIAVHENPKIYVLDTPGITTPKMVDHDSLLKLAVCECVDQSWIGIEIVADYLLYYLNKQRNFMYVSHFSLSEPTDSVLSLLYHIAVMHNCGNKTGEQQVKPNISGAAEIFLAAFRKGKIGRQFMDFEHIKKNFDPSLY